LSGNAKGRKRRFGSVRQLPSGKYQARYTGPDGLMRKAPHSMETKRAADRWLVETEAEMLRGDWLNPEAERVSLNEYAAKWVGEQDLKARTREEYERHLRLHVRPTIGTRPMSEVASPHIRTWRADLLAAGVGSPPWRRRTGSFTPSSRPPSTTT
jgi:hypothetical protein